MVGVVGCKTWSEIGLDMMEIEEAVEGFEEGKD